MLNLDAFKASWQEIETQLKQGLIDKKRASELIQLAVHECQE